MEAKADIQEKRKYTADEIKRLAPGYRGKAENFDPAKVGKKKAPPTPKTLGPKSPTVTPPTALDKAQVLREKCRSRGLATAGTKAELFTRLTEKDPDDEWMLHSEERDNDAHAASKTIDVPPSETIPVKGDQRELELARKQVELAERQHALARGEVELLRGIHQRSQSVNDYSSMSMTTEASRPNMDVSVIADLLSSFHGSGDSYKGWENQDTSSVKINDSSDKRSIKKYGSKLDTTGSPSRSRSTTKELIQPSDDSMRPPQFTQKLKNLTINDGEHLELTAKVDGDPEPQITWSKDGKMLSSSEVVDLKYKNGVATLTINEVFPEDEGEYACLATNSIGSDTTSCKLTVKPVENAAKKKQGDEKSPKIVDHLTSKYVKDGEAVTLSCRIIGAKKFDVVWLHNNKEIKPSKDFQYTSEANIYKLIIAEIFPEDSGTYTCEAFNDAGESYSSCTLSVLASNEEPKSPAFATFPQSATVSEGESVTFTCKTDIAPLKVTWLKDGKAIPETSSRYHFSSDGSTSFEFGIKTCTAIDVGQYLARAIGQKGETNSAFALNVVNPGEL